MTDFWLLVVALLLLVGCSTFALQILKDLPKDSKDTPIEDLPVGSAGWCPPFSVTKCKDGNFYIRNNTLLENERIGNCSLYIRKVAEGSYTGRLHKNHEGKKYVWNKTKSLSSIINSHSKIKIK